MTPIDSVRTDYAVTFLADTARDSDINPDQINKCHGLIADELTRLREENAKLREALNEYLDWHETNFVLPSGNFEDPDQHSLAKAARQALGDSS